MEPETVKYDRTGSVLGTSQLAHLPFAKYMSSCITYSAGMLRMLCFTKDKLSFLQVSVKCCYLHCRKY